MIDKNRLEQKCSMWNIALTGEQLDQLDAFAQILVDYNQKVNLTAITDPEGIEDKHFLDSLLFASQPEVAGKMVDVGAGAGFPGIVTKIYKPERRAHAASRLRVKRRCRRARRRKADAPGRFLTVQAADPQRRKAQLRDRRAGAKTGLFFRRQRVHKLLNGSVHGRILL